MDSRTPAEPKPDADRNLAIQCSDTISGRLTALAELGKSEGLDYHDLGDSEAVMNLGEIDI